MSMADFGEDRMPVEEIEIFEVVRWVLRRSGMGRCVEYRKISEEIYGKKRYSELIDRDIAKDLGALIYTVDKDKRKCV